MTLTAGAEPTEAGGFDGDDADDGSETNGNMTVDFGFVQLGLWTGNVSKDTTNDDNGDTMLSGVAIELFTDPNGDGDSSDGVSVGITITDANGDYNFTNLLSGDYVAVETQPSGLDDVKENEGGLDDDKPDNSITNSIAGTVNPGETDTNNDFVEEEPGSWTGNVSKDTTNDDNGDTILSGVTIELFTDPNGDGDSSDGISVGTTITDANGDYNFTNLTPGDYVAVETQPVGFENVKEDEGGLDDDKPDNSITNAIAGTVDAGEVDANNDFVEEEPGEITGNVSKDTNNNDSGDENLSGVIIELFEDTDGDGQPDGTAIEMVITDENGSFTFLNVTPGDYVVVETQPNGYLDVSEDEGGSDDDKPDNGITNSIAVTVDAGETDTNNDFVEEEPGSWTGNVSKDTTNDDNGDTILSGVTIELFTDPNGDGDSSDGISVGTTTTDANGDYNFTNLTPGDYVAVETQPVGFENVKEDEGGLDDDKPDNSITNAIAGTVDAGEVDANNDFVERELGSLNGNVSYEDSDGTHPLGGVTIVLFDDHGIEVARTITDENGNYEFVDLIPGNYIIREEQPDGFFDLSENEGGGDDDNSTSTTNNEISATVGAGENDVENDFVEVQEATLGDYVWYDTDKDGIQDIDENGVFGVVIYLLDANGDRIQENGNDIFTETNSTGGYIFTGLNPLEEYAVEFDLSTLPGDFSVTLEGEGTEENDSDADTNTGKTAVVSLSPGEHNGDLDMGISQDLFRIGTLFWIDANQDGAFSPGEEVISGALIELLNENGNPVLDKNGKAITTVTDANGEYYFDVEAGKYNVKFNIPDELSDNGYVFSGVQTIEGDNLNRAGVNGITTAVEVGPGIASENLTLDAGVNCGCANVSTDSSDALGFLGMLAMMLMTLFTALFFVRKEEQRV